MTIASTIARYLLGLLFTVFGANGFLHFITPAPPASAFGQQFMAATFGSHFMGLIFMVQLACGVLLLAGRYVPLALVMLAGVLVNILNYHITMDPSGIGSGLLATVLWFVTAWRYRANLRGIFAATSAPAPDKPVAEYVPA